MSQVIAQQEKPSQKEKYDDAATPEKTTYNDSSGPIFSIYIAQAQKMDEENVENWKGIADRILVFAGLFSSTVAIFIAISYPNLQQDPNIITQSLLAQISQQLPNPSSNDNSGISSRSSFVPPRSIVFINSVWFLSLVLSLICALLATLFQQWAHKYLHTIRRNHAPHVRAHIREYFARGARKFGIFGLVEALPFLLFVSVHLFFAGLVAFAFHANHTVAYFTVAIVGFCTLSFIAITLMPLIFHDCPYYTPLTPVLWYSAQIIPLSFLSVLYHGAKQMHDRWGTVSDGILKVFRDRHEYKVKSLSEGMISKFENSAKRISMDIYKGTLVRTLHWLNEDRDLEEFVAGIPGLCESNALAMPNNSDTQRTIRDILVVLPGPTSFHASLPWSIIQLAQRAFTSQLPKSVQQRRTRACLKALYYIPGAIRDVLAPYAAGKHYCLEILPLLNTPESLEIIDELWGSPNDDVALSVRCAAAVIAAFMITPPRRTLDNFVAPDVGFIWDDNTGKQFLAKRLRVGVDADSGAVPEYHPRSDSARLRNIVRFLTDINDTLRYINTQWWASDNADSIRRERRKLFDTRRTEEYRIGRGTFDQQGDRGSPAFVPAAQQDLITITLEILARDPVANAATSQRDAFREACMQLAQAASTQARAQALSQTHGRTRVLSEFMLETLARTQAQAADSIEVVKRALEPVAQSLRSQTNDTPTPYSDLPLSPILGQQIVPANAPTVPPENGPVLSHVESAQDLSPPPIEAVPPLQHSVSPSLAGLAPATGESGHSNLADALV
ncbi:hypothetical protein EDB92DRAFT_684308 [Lactarius akahatsu]|uniref:DUF6535 domain-containing protein n=1 Tax=Lactarius akahatsu TaxID=416441 RepID=A0AAD4LJ64_9AGAM|nr:hypothetical protein EDB92DRAFT_684308 [Lactarius akahatsu]